MGEARRKAQAGQVSEALLAALQARAVGGTGTPGEAAVALVMDIAREAEVRQALGELPPLVQQSLAGIRELPAAKGGEAKAVVWVRWPGGRQWVRLARSVVELRDQGARELALDATVRGHDLRVAAFPDDGWAAALGTLATQQAPFRPTAEEMAAAEGAVHRLEGGHGFVVPRRADARAQRAVAATLLHAFDAFVADAESFGESRGRVFIEFEGHDDDTREFWDIEPCRELLRMLDRHAAWWPWLADPAQHFAWLGALLSTAPTQLTEAMEVAFPFDETAFRTLMHRTVSASASAALAAGIDPRTSPEVRTGLEDIRQRLVHTAQTLSERWRSLQDGDIGPVPID